MVARTVARAVDVILESLGRRVAPPSWGKRSPVSVLPGHGGAHGHWILSLAHTHFATRGIQYVYTANSLHFGTETVVNGTINFA